MRGRGQRVRGMFLVKIIKERSCAIKTARLKRELLCRSLLIPILAYIHSNIKRADLFIMSSAVSPADASRHSAN